MNFNQDLCTSGLLGNVSIKNCIDLYPLSPIRFMKLVTLSPPTIVDNFLLYLIKLYQCNVSIFDFHLPCPDKHFVAAKIINCKILYWIYFNYLE